MKRLVLLLIKFYQKTLSLDKGFLGSLFGYPKICRFDPSCSQYTYDAVYKYGIFKGSYLGIKRIFRCHPLNKGGFDPVK